MYYIAISVLVYGLVEGANLMVKSIANLFALFSENIDSGVEQETNLKLAAAVLLVEVMMADHKIDDAERDALARAVQNFLDLNHDESLALLEQAQTRHEELVSLHEVTKVINAHSSAAQKISLIEYMWQIAYADKQWDKYEEHLIRKVSDLIYVSHKDFIRAKHLAQCDE